MTIGAMKTGNRTCTIKLQRIFLGAKLGVGFLEFLAMFTVIVALVVVGAIWWIWSWAGCDPSALESAPFEYDIDAATKFQLQVKDRKEKFLVIGCGFLGLGLSCSLKRKRIPFEIIEARDEVGGI